MAFWSQPRYDLYLYRAGWDMSVMTGPEEGAATAGQGHLRSAQADRDRVIATLKAAFVQGRLDKDELDARVGQALASRTYAELAALTSDVPAGPAGIAAARPAEAAPPGSPARTFARAARDRRYAC